MAAGGSAHASPRPHATSPQDDVAAQYPDRLSVSLKQGTRRIIIPATRLSAVYFDRGASYVKIEGDGYATVLDSEVLADSCSLKRFGRRRAIMMMSR